MSARADDPDLAWTEDLIPISNRFGDVYFSADDGLAESRTVFLDGCGLPQAWAGRLHFTVGELGFGTGLNVAALLQLWRNARPMGGHLHVFSVEAFPMAVDEAARALSRWPELGDAAGALIAGWPARTPGFHRLDLTAFGATVDVAVLDAAEALAAWSGCADAWFLDGFSPAKNPGMWSEEVLSLVRARSAPGARVATFTVAGPVRRGLQGQGFTVSKRRGHGRKRERLEAVLPGVAPAIRPPSRIAVVGAGIAGAATARALRAQGAEVVVIEAETVGAGASGNPAALVTPRFDAGGGPDAALFAQAFERATAIYDGHPDAIIARGALQLEAGERDGARFDRIAGQPLWAPGALLRLNAAEASQRLGEPTDRGGLFIRDALVIEPAPVLRALLDGVAFVSGIVAGLESLARGWRLIDGDGAVLAEADAVCLAAGWGLAALAPHVPLTPARGQASWAEGATAGPAAWGGYVLPTREGLLFGSTFDRGDVGTAARPADQARNLATLAETRPELAARVAEKPLQARARIRATTADHLPVVGELEPGLWVLGGLGARGFTTAPLLGEHVAAAILGLPSPLPRPLARRLRPDRWKPLPSDPARA